MALCYQKHPFEIESEDRLTSINTKIFEIKKKIQLSEGQRKSQFEENDAERRRNAELISTLKQEVRLRLAELARARAAVDDQLGRGVGEVCPVGDKTAEQVTHNLDLKVIEQRKTLDLLKYEKGSKRKKLRTLEKEYELLLIESTKSDLVKSKITTRARKNVSHLENEIHKVLIQWTEAELVKKKYSSIRQALIEDSVKFESSLTKVEELIDKQKEEIKKLERVREEAGDMRVRASAAAALETSRAHDAEHARAAERAYFAQRFDQRRRELEKLEKRIFPPAARAVRQESTRSTEADATTEEGSAVAQMEDVFQRLMKLTGVTDPEEVFDRFRGQRETCRRLGYLQQTIEQEKLQLEQTQTTLIAELEGYKFASVKDKDEGQDKIQELKDEIEAVDLERVALAAGLQELDGFLADIAKLLHDLCKILDVIPEPAIPEWSVRGGADKLLQVLGTRLARASARADAIAEKTDVKADTTVVLPSNTTSGAPSVTGVSHSSHRESDKLVPTYRDLVEREPARPPPSDEEEDIPSRCYLKRQAQLILDTKCRRKGFRPPYQRK